MSKEIDYNYLEETKVLKGKIELAFLSLGGRFMKIRDEKLWMCNYETFAEWLQEVDMSESSVSKLISVYNKFVIQFPIPEEKLLKCGGWSQLAEILPLVKDQESAEYWTDIMITDDGKGIRDKVREAKSGINSEECYHDYYEMRICRLCGDKHRIYDEK